MRSLVEIRQIIEQLSRQINASDNFMPTYENSRHDGTPNIEIGDSVYFYRTLDRNVVTENRQTNNLNLLLYWVFSYITFSMASEYELTHRIPNQDFRRIMFSHQEKLLSVLSPQWAARNALEHIQILETSPFDDDCDFRSP